MNFDFARDFDLKDDRVYLRPLVPEDSENLWPIAQQGEELVMYSPIHVHTKEHLKSYVEKTLSERDKGWRFAFSIYDRQANKYAGSTSFGDVSNNNKSLEIGWTWIGKEYQRTGLNRHCKYLMMRYAFDSLRFHRIQFRIDERNAQSRTAVEAIGGKLEGTHRSDVLMMDGQYRNTCYYSILDSEWPAIKESVFKDF